MEYLKKTLAILVVLALVFPQAAWALPSPTSAMNDIMADLGMDKDEVKKTVNDTLNVASFKKTPPNIQLTFVPENPTPGKKITVIATPTNFTGNAKEMYFTWYLKRKNQTDWDGDGKTNKDLDDQKIEAGRILARGESEEIYVYDTDDDKDGYEASFGGGDQKGKPAHCYVKDVASGIDYLIGTPGKDPQKDPPKERCEHLFPKSASGEKIGDGEFGLEEEEFWGTDPHSKDTNNDGVSDEEALTGHGMISFSWTYQAGDNIGVAAEGVTDNTDFPESSLKTMWATSKNTCEIAKPNVPVGTKDDRNVYKFAYHSCDYPTEVKVTIDCVDNEGVETIGPFFNPVIYERDGGQVPNNCGDSTDKIGDPECKGKAFELCSSIPPNGNGCGRCYFEGPPVFSLWKGGGESDSRLAILLPGSYGDYNCDVCVWNESDSDYYYPPGHEGDEAYKIEPGKQVECGPFKAKMNWEEVPRASSDTDINDCLEDNLVDPAESTSQKNIEVNLSYSPKNPTNDPAATEDSMGSADELSIKSTLLNIENESFVKYAWKFWLCDDNGENCTPELSAKALQENLNLARTSGIGLDSLRAKMRIKIGSPAYSDFAGKSKLKVELRVAESTRSTEGKEGRGLIFIPFQNTSEKIDAYGISVEKLTAALDSDVKVVMGQQTREADCLDGICPAVKNEIIGLKFSGNNVLATDIFSWSLDGKPILNDESDPTKKNQVFFPILKGAGEKYEIQLDISKEDPLTGTMDGKKKMTLTKTFATEDPEAKIVPGCDDPPQTGCVPPERIVLGTFKDPTMELDDPNNTGEEDMSQDKFQGKKGDVTSLEPAFNFNRNALAQKDAAGNIIGWNFQWFVDGTEITSNSPSQEDPYVELATGNLGLPLKKNAGEKYTISLEATYNQPELYKRALYTIWNVSPDSFYETTVEDSIEIEVVEDAALLPYSGPKKIMASLFAGAPEYLNFLFRIFLTLGLILFLSNLSLVMFPKNKA